jgi:hypothetical protein
MNDESFIQKIVTNREITANNPLNEKMDDMKKQQTKENEIEIISSNK